MGSVQCLIRAMERKKMIKKIRIKLRYLSFKNIAKDFL